mmetsp:Transcript_70692/g.188525  ORF Transcript_70692/g.188525 Transcript_70692/m.188525 type:complete len:218 (-) Transcript_70692:703-1356(-)
MQAQFTGNGAGRRIPHPLAKRVLRIDHPHSRREGKMVLAWGSTGRALIGLPEAAFSSLGHVGSPDSPDAIPANDLAVALQHAEVRLGIPRAPLPGNIDPVVLGGHKIPHFEQSVHLTVAEFGDLGEMSEWGALKLVLLPHFGLQHWPRPSDSLVLERQNASVRGRKIGLPIRQRRRFHPKTDPFSGQLERFLVRCSVQGGLGRVVSRMDPRLEVVVG